MELIDAALNALEEKSATVKGLVAELRATQAAQKLAVESDAASPAPASSTESVDSAGCGTPDVDPSLNPL